MPVKQNNYNSPTKVVGYSVLGVIIIIAVLIILFGSWFIVPKGSNGCVFSNTNGWDYMEKGQGWHFKVPIVESVDKLSFQTQTLGMYGDGDGERTVITPKDKNGINFNVDVTVRYRMDANQICEFIEQKGKDPEALLVTALRADSTRGVFGKYAQEDIPDNRIEIAKEIRRVLQERINSEAAGGRLNKNFILIEAVDIRNLEFAEKIENAIIEKQTQKQEAEKQSYILQKAEKEKEIRIVQANATREAAIIEAEGTAKAIILEAEAKAKGIQKINDAYKGMPQSYVEVKYAEALAEVATAGNSVVMDLGRFQGGSNIGLLDYNKLMAIQTSKYASTTPVSNVGVAEEEADEDGNNK